MPTLTQPGIPMDMHAIVNPVVASGKLVVASGAPVVASAWNPMVTSANLNNSHTGYHCNFTGFTLVLSGPKGRRSKSHFVSFPRGVSNVIPVLTSCRSTPSAFHKFFQG
jgi:hypothetical protein